MSLQPKKLEKDTYAYEQVSGSNRKKSELFELDDERKFGYNAVKKRIEFDNSRSGSITRPSIHKKITIGISDLNKSPEELKALCESNTEVRDFLREVQAEVHYILVKYEVQKRKSASAKLSVINKPLNNLICSKIGLLSEDDKYSEDTDITFKAVSDLLQKISYALEASYISGIRVNDLDIPYHPMEAQLLDIIEGKYAELKPKKYTRADKFSSEEYYKKHYEDYINADVMYQDYLDAIDDKLKDLIRKKSIIPSSKERTEKLRIKLQEIIKSDDSVLKKSERIKGIYYRDN